MSDEKSIDPRKHVTVEITLRGGGAKRKLHTSKRPVPNGERIMLPYKEALGYVERDVARFVEEFLTGEDENETDEAATPAE